jgi:hypothetical protein
MRDVPSPSIRRVSFCSLSSSAAKKPMPALFPRTSIPCRPGRRSELYHRPQLKGQAGDDLDMFLTHDAGGATGVSGFISYDFCRLTGRVPRPSFTFLFQGASMRCFVSSSIDLGSRLR